MDDLLPSAFLREDGKLFDMVKSVLLRAEAVASGGSARAGFAGGYLTSAPNHLGMKYLGHETVGSESARWAWRC